LGRKNRRVSGSVAGKFEDFQRIVWLKIIRAMVFFFIAFFMDAERENRYANVFFFC